MTHTPGPWWPYRKQGYSNLFIGSGTHDVAEATHAGGEEHRQANAQLIAAAPELLAALNYMVENAEADGWSELMLSDAKAAIAKAEGRE